MVQLLSDPWWWGLLVLGTLVGSLVNLGVYRLAWHPRPISPWGPRPAAAPTRRWSDRIPVFGWLGLRREAALHGRGFWIRPMLVELLAGLGFALLYWWEVREHGLLPLALRGQPWGGMLIGQYATHLVLMTLMLTASLIDADEKIIPDSITVTGTLVGLSLMAIFPQVMLPCLMPNGAPRLEALHLGTPNGWPAGLDGAPQLGSLAWGLACWWLWCVALLRRTWYPRHGWRRALGLSLARLRRDAFTGPILVMGLIGSALVAAVWYSWGTSEHWHGLLTALVGMVVGGLMIWVVRIVGSAALGREAMGFGDVTLMAMIGAFLGWQSCLVIFFLAPFAALVVGILTLVFQQEHEIPYGPFLCLAATFVVVQWAAVWRATADSFGLLFALGWGIVAGILLGMVALLLLLLSAWRLFLYLLR